MMWWELAAQIMKEMDCELLRERTKGNNSSRLLLETQCKLEGCKFSIKDALQMST